MDHRVVGPFLLVMFLEENARRAQFHLGEVFVAEPCLPTHAAVEIDRLGQIPCRQEYALVNDRWA
jgi:hypothetical protein